MTQSYLSFCPSQAKQPAPNAPEPWRRRAGGGRGDGGGALTGGGAARSTCGGGTGDRHLSFCEAGHETASVLPIDGHVHTHIIYLLIYVRNDCVVAIVGTPITMLPMVGNNVFSQSALGWKAFNIRSTILVDHGVAKQ